MFRATLPAAAAVVPVTVRPTFRPRTAADEVMTALKTRANTLSVVTVPEKTDCAASSRLLVIASLVAEKNAVVAVRACDMAREVVALKDVVADSVLLMLFDTTPAEAFITASKTRARTPRVARVADDAALLPERTFAIDREAAAVKEAEVAARACDTVRAVAALNDMAADWVWLMLLETTPAETAITALKVRERTPNVEYVAFMVAEAPAMALATERAVTALKPWNALERRAEAVFAVCPENAPIVERTDLLAVRAVDPDMANVEESDLDSARSREAADVNALAD